MRPITNLISILPIIIPITLWIVLQWQVLRTEAPVSRWWIAAPALAGIPQPNTVASQEVLALENFT
jgi:hypothetical protein